ncbi:FecR family protein [Sphingobacterium lumbrici]|uniref:FecR family protein n=1 Tax=Sphingobacterium lumbrici TaxID=2559600 RepID=UPI00112DDF0E|nr:FecR domain-containing protein [Sphingobacterium lumbrici]
MESQKNSRQLKQIIKRYLKGTATKEELMFLEQWDRFIDKNHNEFENLSLEEKKELGNTIKECISQGIQHSRPKVRKIRWIRYAAAILIFLSVGISIYWYRHNAGNSQSTQFTSLYGDDVLPGTNRATITLADGSSYELSEAKEGVQIHEDGIQYEDGSTVASGLDVAHATISTPNGGQYRLTLPDGTKVWVNAASSLTYPTKFNTAERKVELTGEAYFEVHKDTERPFIVHTKGQTIEVLGTRFNVNAYVNETATRTTLVEGSVAVQTTNGIQKLLKPNQQAIQHDGEMYIIPVEPEEYIAWTKGEIVLSNAELPTILRQLERWYDVSFDEIPASLGRKTVFGVLDRNLPLNDVLNSLEKNYKLKFKIQGRRVSIELR